MNISPNLEVWTTVIAGDEVVTREDQDAENRLMRAIEKGYIEEATSVPQKYAYGNGKFLFYMRVDKVEELEAAYALIAQVYAKEKESHSCQK